MKSEKELLTILCGIDRKGYPAYKTLHGTYQFGDYILSIDHVQGDPFAAPSRLSIFVPRKKAGFPAVLLDTDYKRCAAADYILRMFGKVLGKYTFQAGGSGKSGLIAVSRPGQEVLQRSACCFEPDGLRVRFEVGFPAAGRTVLARELQKILFDYLPDCAHRSLFYRALPAGKLEQAVFLSEDQAYLRGQLDALGLCAFIADGSVLPRKSGVSDLPMEHATAFVSPESLAVTLTLPHHGVIRGMGVRKGITVIAGGGYHGKSTLLKALERGVYNHIAGDGREFVLTQADAMKLRAEDGRKITNTDISLFINGLPNGTDTKHFSTLDASGSTSQAASIIEALEAGSRLFLIDEDTSATNFMVRDALMESVIPKSCEPITPFLEWARDLYEKAGVSSILVIGSSGSYFHIADTILQMDCYRCLDITVRVKKLLKTQTAFQAFLQADCFSLPAAGRTLPFKKASSERPPKVKTLGKTAFLLDKEEVDLRYVEQLTDSEQTTALSFLLRYVNMHLAGSKLSLTELVNRLEALMDEKGLGAICDSPYVPADLARPRRQEIFACFNRY